MRFTRQFTIRVIQDGKEKVIHQGSAETYADVMKWAKGSPNWELVAIQMNGKKDCEIAEIYAKEMLSARGKKEFLAVCDDVPVSFQSMVKDKYLELKNAGCKAQM